MEKITDEGKIVDMIYFTENLIICDERPNFIFLKDYMSKKLKRTDYFKILFYRKCHYM